MVWQRIVLEEDNEMAASFLITPSDTGTDVTTIAIEGADYDAMAYTLLAVVHYLEEEDIIAVGVIDKLRRYLLAKKNAPLN